MKALVATLVALMLNGCSILPQAQPVAVHDFGYPALSPESYPLTQSKVTVEAPMWLSDTRIRYRLLYAEPTQVRFYSLDQWLAPPHELLQPLFETHGKQWPAPITIQLQAFEQQFEAPGRAKATIRFHAISDRNGNKNNPRTKDFLLQKPCPSADAKGAVAAFSLLTKEAADEVQTWLYKAE